MPKKVSQQQKLPKNSFRNKLRYISKALKSSMDTGQIKQSKRSSAIVEHILKNNQCSKNYNDSCFLVLIKASNEHK